jgi:hypothetical protein
MMACRGGSGNVCEGTSASILARMCWIPYPKPRQYMIDLGQIENGYVGIFMPVEVHQPLTTEICEV